MLFDPFIILKIRIWSKNVNASPLVLTVVQDLWLLSVTFFYKILQVYVWYCYYFFNGMHDLFSEICFLLLYIYYIYIITQVTYCHGIDVRRRALTSSSQELLGQS